MKMNFYLFSQVMRSLLLQITVLLLLGYGTMQARTADDFSALACCKAPSDVTVWCNDLPYDFDPYNVYQLQSLFGKAKNACGGQIIEMTPVVNLSNCETGTIIRKFKTTAYDWYGSVEYCQQVVTIGGVHDYEIRFPADVTINACGSSTPPKEDVIVSESSCDLLATSVRDDVYSISGSQCYKILRTYRVINWCEYDGISPAVVVNRDEDCDNKPGDEAVWVLRRPSHAFIDRDNYESNNNPYAGEKGCYPSNPKGYWRKVYSVGLWEYTQIIKVNETTPPSVTFTAPEPFCSYDYTCKGMVTVPFTVSENCTPNNLTIKVFVDVNKNGTNDGTLGSFGGTLSGSYPYYSAKGKFPIGTHQFEIHVIDGCGNSNIVKIPFSVKDCKAPSVICINGLSVSLMPVIPNKDVDYDGDVDKGMMTLWVSDFIVSQSSSDCSGSIKYSINRVGETPNMNRRELILTCDDPDRVYVEIYAWDNAYNPLAVQPDGTIGGPNYDHCETYVNIRKPASICPPPPPVMGTIAGFIMTEDSISLEGASMMLSGNLTDTSLTQEDGTYIFDHVVMYKNYKITPVFHSDPKAGITIEDLALLEAYLAGLPVLGSPYQLIAADVDQSGVIDTLDALALRALVENVVDTLPGNKTWRFVDAAYQFPDTALASLKVVPDFIHIDGMASDINHANFIAIRIGDLNRSLMVIETTTAAVHAAHQANRGLKPAQWTNQPPTAELYQNIPNPFSTQTTIAFSLPEASRAVLRVFNAKGQLLKTVEGQFDKGFHQLVLEKAELGAPGILFYQLQTAQFTATRKMILME